MVTDMYKKHFKSGFIAIIGAPNVGKSTLLNRILGQKISITSKKPQTTRNRILGILHREEAQFVFLDTPGVHRARQPLNVRNRPIPNRKSFCSTHSTIRKPG